MSRRPQRIRDPIHNLIEFEDGDFEQMCWRVIQTPQVPKTEENQATRFFGFRLSGSL